MSVVVVNTPESNTHITNIDDDCVQQAAVDLRLERVWGMNGPFTIDEEQKQHRNKYELSVDDEGYFNLGPGVYECSTSHGVDMGHDEVGYLVTRSTLNRNGVFITSGLYDPGYAGKMALCLHVTGGTFRIKENTRIGQFLVLKVANAQGQYDGDYGLDQNGQAKEMEKRYYS